MISQTEIERANALRGCQHDDVHSTASILKDKEEFGKQLWARAADCV